MNYETYEVRIFEDGCKIYYQNGERHRTDGPAVEWADGTKFYWQNGKRHRTDGPAVEWADGTKEYYIEGEELSKEEFDKRMSPSCDGRTVTIDGKSYKLQLVEES